MHVSGLYRYPVKSLGGQALDAARVEHCGISGDRRWMVVDGRGRFVTRREAPAMALLHAEPTTDGLILRHPTLGTCAARRPDGGAESVAATIWRDAVPVRLGTPDADAFLSAALGRDVRLAWQFDAALRPVHSSHAHQGDHVSLADGFPLLVTTEASLDALNARAPVRMEMARFRPNLVVTGARAWEENGWQRIRVGEVVLRLTKPCSRCVIVTQEPDTGERLHGNEPLTSLRGLGRVERGQILFGENAIPELLGTMRVGDPVEVLD